MDDHRVFLPEIRGHDHKRVAAPFPFTRLTRLTSLTFLTSHPSLVRPIPAAVAEVPNTPNKYLYRHDP